MSAADPGREATLEALATGRDGVPPAQRAELEREAPEELAAARALAIDVGLLFEAHAPAMDAAHLDRLTRRALAARPPAPKGSRLAAAGFVGAAVTSALAYGSLGPGAWTLPTVHDVAGAVAATGALFRGLDAAVNVVPGGWEGLALGLSLAMALLLVPSRRLLVQTAPAAALLALALAFPASVWAQRAPVSFEGAWPAGERVTLEVEREPTSQVLRRAAEAVGLGLVASLPEDPPLTLHLQDRTLREVVDAALPGGGFHVLRTSTLLVVRPEDPAGDGAPQAAARRTPSPAPPPRAPALPAAPAAPAGDRISFGSDVHVRPDERVRSVVTMGGDARIEGEVLGEVVTMGGDVRVGESAIIRGQLVTMGGEVSIAEGAALASRDAAAAAAADDDDDDDDAAAVRSSIGVAARFGALYLLGLVLLGLAPDRHRRLAAAVVRAPGRSGLAGLLGLLAGGVLSVILTITLVGIPAAILLVLVTCTVFFAGAAVGASVIGAAMPLGVLRGRPLLQLGAGVALLFLLSFVPGLGAFAFFVAATFGVGAMLLTRVGQSGALVGLEDDDDDDIWE